MQSRHGLRPDFIFFTGDIVYGTVNGESMADQYQIARQFLEAVRTAFDPQISTRDIYLVPGNHDVDRDEILPEQTQWLRQKNRTLEEIIAAMRDGRKQWRSWMERLISYRNFLTSYGLTHLEPNDSHLIWADSREIHDIRIGIAGLNSAWSCADDSDKANLWLGLDWQIAQLKERMGPVDFAIALIHHPGNWLKEQEDPSAMRRLKQEFALVLHGHEHQEWVESDLDGRLVLSAGACYDSSKNGYSFGCVDFDNLQANIYLRQWDPTGRGWVARNVAGKTQDGCRHLPNLSWLRFTDSVVDASAAESKINNNHDLSDSEESAETHYTQRYCHFVIDHHDGLELFGCDIPRELQRHQLAVAYVSLNLTSEDDAYPTKKRQPLPLKNPSEKLIQDVFEDDKRQQHIFDESSTALEDVLDKISTETSRLLINGPAGSGKSTLMRWSAIHAAGQVLNNPTEQIYSSNTPISPSNPVDTWNVQKPGRVQRHSWRKKVPFLIRLRDCPNGQLPAANELPTFLAKHLPSAPRNWMTNLLGSGQALVLFDGVDEIHRDQRRQLEEEIGELIRTYPDCTYVVTTRPGAVAPGWLSRLNFVEARVEPMSRQDREEFIDKWYRSAALELKLKPRPGENLAQTAVNLKAELAEQSELGLLATNPLLCAMICALYRERQEKLPETPAELSKALCEMLLHRRERETPGLADKHFLTSWRELKYAQKEELLAELAWRMVSKGRSSIERSDAKALVAETLYSIPGRSQEEADDILQALVERSGMLRPAGVDRIDFIHNTLKEYLAANCIVGKGDWKLLVNYADDPAWQPVILFALALAPESFSSNLVGELIKCAESLKNPMGKVGALTKAERKTLATIKARQFFLVRCRAVAKRLDKKFSKKIDKYLGHLLPPASMNEAEALAQLGSRILNYGSSTLENGKWWATQSSYMAMRCLRLLRLVGGQKAQHTLRTIYALPKNSTSLASEWVLACNELCPEESLKWPFDKEVVWLTSHRITNINPLISASNFKSIYIYDTRVSSLQPLTGMKSLNQLSLWRTLVSDLSPIAELTNLEHLDFSSTRVTDLTPLSTLKKLNWLDCGLTKATDLTPISGLSNLEYLRLDGLLLPSLNPIQNLIGLEHLSLKSVPLDDLKPLENLKSLKYLNLANTKVLRLKPILGLSLLECLNVAKTNIENADEVASFTNLRDLDISETKITDLTPLSNLSSLERLVLGYQLINDLTPLENLKSLETLILHQINITDLSPLIGMKSLKNLYLGKTAILESDLEKFKSLRSDVDVRTKYYFFQQVE
jgi:Leucine-rich repeat (LRR) protein/predicted MPP superfamily phosphohydrolase